MNSFTIRNTATGLSVRRARACVRVSTRTTQRTCFPCSVVPRCRIARSICVSPHHCARSLCLPSAFYLAFHLCINRRNTTSFTYRKIDKRPAARHNPRLHPIQNRISLCCYRYYRYRIFIFNFLYTFLSFSFFFIFLFFYEIASLSSLRPLTSHIA